MVDDEASVLNYEAQCIDKVPCSATHAMLSSDDATMIRNMNIFAGFAPSAIVFREQKETQPQELRATFQSFSIWKYFFATSRLPPTLTLTEFYHCFEFAQYYCMVDFLQALGTIRTPLPDWQYATLSVTDVKFNTFAAQLSAQQYSMYHFDGSFAFYRKLTYYPQY